MISSNQRNTCLWRHWKCGIPVWVILNLTFKSALAATFDHYVLFSACTPIDHRYPKPGNASLFSGMRLTFGSIQGFPVISIWNNVIIQWVTFSSVASPICQEGQSERNFPILVIFPDFSSLSLFFSRFLTIFFAVKGGILPPLPLYWPRHW